MSKIGTFREYLAEAKIEKEVNESKVNDIKGVFDFYYNEIKPLERNIEQLEDAISEDDWDWDPNDRDRIIEISKKLSPKYKLMHNYIKILNIDKILFNDSIEYDKTIGYEKYISRAK